MEKKLLLTSALFLGLSTLCISAEEITKNYFTEPGFETTVLKKNITGDDYAYSINPDQSSWKYDPETFTAFNSSYVRRTDDIVSGNVQTCNGATGTSYLFANHTEAFYQEIELTTGSYVLSFLAGRMWGGGTSPQVTVSNADGVSVFSDTYVIDKANNGSFFNKSFVISIPADGTYKFLFDGGTTDAGYYFYDDFSLVEGDGKMDTTDFSIDISTNSEIQQGDTLFEGQNYTYSLDYNAGNGEYEKNTMSSLSVSFCEIDENENIINKIIDLSGENDIFSETTKGAKSIDITIPKNATISSNLTDGHTYAIFATAKNSKDDSKTVKIDSIVVEEKNAAAPSYLEVTGNLFTNPSFENIQDDAKNINTYLLPTGWTTSNDSRVYQEPVHSGMYSFYVLNSGSLIGNVDLQPGEYTCSFYYSMQGLEKLDETIQKVIFKSDAEEYSYSYVGDTANCSNGNFLKANFDFTVQNAGSFKVTFQTSGTGTDALWHNARFYFDDLVLVPKSATANMNIKTSNNSIYVSNGIVYINSNTNRTINIYDISGLLKETINLKLGENTIKNLDKGYYIIEDTKIFIK